MTSLRLAAALSLLLAPAALQAQPRPLTGEERTGLRCAAAFAMVAAGQARGEPEARRYPPMVPRGREFFVRLSAQLMDDAGLNEAGIKAAAEVEAGALRRDGGVSSAMPLCLRVLDAQPGLGG